MPLLPLTSLLHTALPGLSSDGRAVISALGCFNGNPSSAADLAAMVGMRSRYQLARALRREGLPPLEELAGWARVLYWMDEAERSGTSLRRLVNGADLDVTTAYRLVRRLTGFRWSELKRVGLAAILQQFRDRCHTNGACSNTGPLAMPRHRVAPPPANESAVVSPALVRTCARPRRADPLWCPRSLDRPHRPSIVPEQRLAVPGSPFDVAVHGDALACVTRVRAAALDRLALDPLRVVGSITTGSAPTRVVIDSSGSRAYVTSQFAEHVGVVDLGQGRQTGAIGLSGHPMAAVLSLDGRTLFVTTNVDRLYAVSLPAGRLVASVPVPQQCTEIALDPSGRRLYVPTWRAGDIIEVDARTLRTMRTFHVGGTVQGVVVSANSFTLFAANEAGWLDHIHLGTGRRLARLHFGTTAFAVALSPDETTLYLSLLHAGEVVVLERCTLREVTRLRTGGKPRRIAFDSTGRAAFVANEAGWVDLVR